MKERLKFVLSYYLFWLLYFFLVKILFLLYNFDHTTTLSWATIYKIVFFGFKLDLSFASYISLVPFLVVAISNLFSTKYLRYFILVFTSVILFLLTFISIVDLELYKAWGYRLDSTPLMYLNTPSEMLASAESSPLMLLIIIMVGTLISSFILFYRFIYPQIEFFKEKSYLGVVFFVLLTISLVIPIRGGFKQTPLNVSNVYFSKNNFANHAAINVAWNFFFSLINNDNTIASNYNYFPSNEAFKLSRSLFHGSPQNKEKLLRSEKPNILLITWESFTAKVVGELGGIKGVTPSFNALSKEGLLLTEMYSSGDRSDKGLVGILSGYPSLVHGSILNIPRKAEKLPSLAHDLEQAGYKTKFFYGGEMEFANMKSYFINNFQEIVAKEDFPDSQKISKWGVPDHFVFDRLLQDIGEAKEPFFYNLFTLSSHEPFDIPVQGKYQGVSKDSLFMSSVYYTDSALGGFIKSAKTQKWWENTLVIITADHGTPLPGNTEYNLREKYQVPFLMLGGALNESGRFDKVCSQTDIAKTILDLLSLNSSAYVWSNNIFNPDFQGHAYYVFNNGFGFITKDQYVIFNHNLKATSYYANPDTTEAINKGKALSQMISSDFKMK